LQRLPLSSGCGSAIVRLTPARAPLREPTMNAKSKPPERTGRSIPSGEGQGADDETRVWPEPLILGEGEVVTAIRTQSEGDGARARLAWWIVGGVGLSLLAIFVASFFLDSIVRSRLERTINASLSGYHASLPSAHLQLLDGVLTLSGLTVTQDADPSPPVVFLPALRAQIQWREMLSMRVVADFRLLRPEVHIDLAQLRAQRANQIPLRQETNVLAKIYPFKINRFQVADGTVSYSDEDPSRPLRLEHVNLTADNIRIIHSPAAVYPSPFHATASVFGRGTMTIDGHGNFMEMPSPGLSATYRISQVPLAQFAPELKRANLELTGGTLDVYGLVEHSPTVAKAEVYEAAIDAADINYIHTARTTEAEQKRLSEVKYQAEEASRPGIVLKVDRLDITNSRIAYTNDIEEQPYKLCIGDLTAAVTNLSNSSNGGESSVNLSGRFMDRGDVRVLGAFRPEQPGPDLRLNVAVRDADLISLNDLLLAYGGFDVQSGTLSIYSQATINGDQITGYVKPLFSDLEVYNRSKDHGKPILHDAYELAMGGAAKLVTNHSSGVVATKVDISGKLDNPDLSIWQAIEELASNAFVKAIRPGFDQQAKPVQD
jgi:hypothetical protein